MVIFDVDFGAQPNVTDKDLDRENGFWTEERPLYEAQMGRITRMAFDVKLQVLARKLA